jgi:hypothetical protein
MILPWEPPIYGPPWKGSSLLTFPETPWAIQFSDEYHIDDHKADWQWETGFGNFNTIYEAEQIRDHNLRAIFGNWSYLKNNKEDKYAHHELGMGGLYWRKKGIPKTDGRPCP